MPGADNSATPGMGGRIGEHHHAYRQGLVLGLTLAEAAILIVFVLLLLIAFEALTREQELAAKADLTEIPKEELADLVEQAESLDVLKDALGLESEVPPDDFERLVEALAAISQDDGFDDALQRLRELEEERTESLTELQRIVSATGSMDGATISATLREQADRLANKEGQLVRLERELKSLGAGGDSRPCWVRPDGRIDYLYDVILVPGGFRMRQYEHGHRWEEISRLALPRINPEDVVSETVFLNITRPIYERSVADNCRFFVRIFDGLPEHEKRRYQRLRETVEGHFYINSYRQHDPAPF